ncbi:MAG: response regulator [Verrucomicrobiales bacterium]
MAPEEPQIQAPARIMVADDEPGVLMVTKAVLESLGHVPVLVSSGEEAVESYREHMDNGERIDLTIMDLTFPGGMTGIEAAHALLAIDPGVRVIAASGYLEQGAGQRFREEGFFGVLHKPVTVEKLKQIVHWGLSKVATAWSPPHERG